MLGDLGRAILATRALPVAGGGDGGGLPARIAKLNRLSVIAGASQDFNMGAVAKRRMWMFHQPREIGDRPASAKAAALSKRFGGGPMMGAGRRRFLKRFGGD